MIETLVRLVIPDSYATPFLVSLCLCLWEINRFEHVQWCNTLLQNTMRKNNVRYYFVQKYDRFRKERNNPFALRI